VCLPVQETLHADDSRRKAEADIKKNLSSLIVLAAAEEAVVQQKPQVAMEAEGWVPVPAGEFLYGEKKEKRYLPAFQIRRAPVTNAEYAEFVWATGHAAPDHWPNGQIPPELAQHPVVNVSWYDAEAYCQWGKCRLPTQAEWEKAARGTDGRECTWGSEPPDAQRSNFEGKVGKTTPVRQYSPQGDGPYGCVDMVGNVFEWTAEGYGLRGGSWRSGAQAVRAAIRWWNGPDIRHNDIGFRCSR
jgi:formylglycine-generating enzyme required for sulfatase activity